MTTIFHGLYQADHDDHEADATLIAVFSTEKAAEVFKDEMSSVHTDMKREANEHNLRYKGRVDIRPVEVPNLYWDIRPVVFDPRTLEELA